MDELSHGHRAKCSFKVSLAVMVCLSAGRAPEDGLQIPQNGSTACVELLGTGAEHPCVLLSLSLWWVSGESLFWVSNSS